MAEEYNLILNSNEMCRNCLAKNTAPNLKSLFRCDIVDGEIWSIPDLYKDIIGIELNENDGFPKNICTKCEKTMFEAFIFRQKSRKSHKLLQRILKMSKHEESEADIYEVEVIEKINSDYIEGDGETVWQTMYLSNVETDNVIIEQDFTSSESLEIKNQLDLSKDVICEICCEQVSQSLLETHFNQHSIIMPSLVSSIEFYRCSRCLMCFPYINLLLEHANAEHLCDRSTELDKEPSYQNISKEPKFRLFSTCKNIDNFTFSCCLCILDFENLFAFRAHFQEHLINLNTHPEYIRSDLAHACGVCGEKFRNLGDCLNHVYFHQTTYACYKTNCKHVTFTSLYFHLIREHSHHNCKFCLFQAKTSNELKEHQRFSCSARQMKCDHCGKLFHKKSTLNMHMRTHTNNRKYVCNLCPKRFLQNNDLTNHLRTHTGEKPFQCELCDAKFKTVGQRSGHRSTHTTKNDFQCDVCEKLFKSARILHGHQKLHGERKFHCNVCGKKFSRNYHLTLHMRRHQQTTNK